MQSHPSNGDFVRIFPVQVERSEGQVLDFFRNSWL
jgi:hypothetical protein